MMADIDNEIRADCSPPNTVIGIETRLSRNSHFLGIDIAALLIPSSVLKRQTGWISGRYFDIAALLIPSSVLKPVDICYNRR